MHLCPSCNRALPDATAACPHCGAAPSRGATPAPAGSVDDALLLAVPDLDIAPPPPRQPAAPAPALRAQVDVEPPSSGRGEMDFGDSGLGDLGDLDPMDIEVVHHEKAANSRPAPARGAPAPIAPRGSEKSAAPPPGPGTTASSDVEIDAFEVQAHADYGLAPAEIWLTPLYALRVLTRQRELKKSLVAARAEHERKKGDVEAALVALAEASRPDLEKDEAGARLFATIREIEARASERGKALESTSSEYAGKVAEIDKELAAVEATLATERGKVAALAGEVARHEEVLGRAEAKLKRADIEMRAAQQAARAAAGPNATVAPPEHAAKIAALQADREPKAAEVLRAKADVDEARRPLTAQERVVAEQQRKIADVKKKRKLLEDTYSRQLAVRGEGVAEAERERKTALVEIARRLIGSARVGAEAPERAAVSVAEKAEHAALVVLEKNLRALDAYDKAALKKGLIVVGGAFAAFLLLLILLSLLMRTEAG